MRIKTAELLNNDLFFQPNLKLVNFSERNRFYAKMKMASIHLNKLHFACLALHPNTVSQQYLKSVGYKTTQSFVHKTTG